MLRAAWPRATGTESVLRTSPIGHCLAPDQPVVDAPVVPGDYVLNHVGFAIRRIPASEIGETLLMYDELLRRADADDLMALDVRGELAAVGERDE